MHARGDEAYDAAERTLEQKELDFRARALHLSADVDSIEITRVMLSTGIRFEDDSLPITGMKVVQGGTTCSGARDEAACAAQVEQKRKALLSHLKCKRQECPAFDFTYALTTRGDEVRTYRSETGLLELFGTIDTPVEAWILLMARKLSYRYGCGLPEYGTHRVLVKDQQPAGFELETRMATKHCHPVEVEEQTYQVTPQGQIKLIKRRVLSSDPEQCIVS